MKQKRASAPSSLVKKASSRVQETSPRARMLLARRTRERSPLRRARQPRLIRILPSLSILSTLRSQPNLTTSSWRKPSSRRMHSQWFRSARRHHHRPLEPPALSVELLPQQVLQAPPESLKTTMRFWLRRSRQDLLNSSRPTTLSEPSPSIWPSS